MKHKKASKGVLIDVALLLLCLLCITTCLSSGIMARYTTGASDKANAKIAVFAVKATAEPSKDDPMKYTVTVQNESETAVRYSLKLMFSDNAPGKVSVKVGDKTYPVNGTELDIENIGTLGVGSAPKVIELELVANDMIDEDITIEAFVRFEQID